MLTAMLEGAMRAATWRWSDNRLMLAATYRAGELLARRPGRVLNGKLRTGSPMALLASDHMHRHIYFYGEWERAVTEQFRQLVCPGSVVFDVGANAGYFSVLARDLGATVHAFEPNPALAGLLRRNVGQTVVEAACSDSERIVPMHLSTGANTGMATLEPTDSPDLTGEIIDVSTVTLDEYVTRAGIPPPDIIKIDVERHEADVLAGARELLQRHRPTLISEVTGRAALNLARELRYKPTLIGGDGPAEVALDRDGECNVLLSPA